MIGWLKKVLAGAPAVDYKQLIADGAQVIDVRNKNEFAGGHISGALNIPLHDIPMQLGKIKKTKVVILCCASGMRSGQAKQLLLQRGYSDDLVHNAGSWMALRNKL
jgi:rhodanese-related sulfurtransferase